MIDMTEQKKTTQKKTVKVGDSIDLGSPANYVTLPDGSVVSARSTYVVQHEGEHRCGDRTFIGKKD